MTMASTSSAQSPPIVSGVAVRTTPDRRWSAAERYWVVALVAAVAIPGAWHLSRLSFWNDEAATWAISGHSFGDLLHVLRTSGGDRGAALYYAVAFVWTRAFGASELALRSLSLVAASVTMVPFHACARRLVAAPAAWAAGAILATSPFLLTYARDARTYALAVLCVVVAVWAFLRAVESVSARDWWIFTGLAVVAVYVHWFSALVVLALFVALARMPPDRALRRRAVTSAIALGALLLPIAGFVLAGADNGVDWIAPLNADELRAVASQFTGTASSWLQVVLGVLLVVGLVASWNGRRESNVSPVVLMWFVLPIGLTIALSTVKPLLVPRYLIVALPAYALLIGLGVSSIARSRVALIAAITLALVVLCYGNVWRTSTGEDWRAIVKTIGERAHPDDAIVVFPATAVSAFSYYARHDSALRNRSGPTWPTTRWASPFTRSIANTDVVHSDRITRARVVWLVVRAPHGNTVTARVRQSPVLATLRRQLGEHFARVAVVSPWSASDTVFVVRYSQPVHQ